MAKAYDDSKKLSAGASVRIDGLQNKPELNGLSGEVVRWVPARDRYEVKVPGRPQSVAIRADNLAELVSGACFMVRDAMDDARREGLQTISAFPSCQQRQRNIIAYFKTTLTDVCECEIVEGRDDCSRFIAYLAANHIITPNGANQAMLMSAYSNPQREEEFYAVVFRVALYKTDAEGKRHHFEHVGTSEDKSMLFLKPAVDCVGPQCNFSTRVSIMTYEDIRASGALLHIPRLMSSYNAPRSPVDLGRGEVMEDCRICRKSLPVAEVMVVAPCGHHDVCVQCARQCSNCPTCDAAWAKKDLVYPESINARYPAGSGHRIRCCWCGRSCAYGLRSHGQQFDYCSQRCLLSHHKQSGHSATCASPTWLVSEKDRLPENTCLEWRQGALHPRLLLIEEMQRADQAQLALRQA